MRVAAAAVLVVLLAGCAAAPPEAADETQPATPEPSLFSIHVVDCQGALALAMVDDGPVADWMPEGYSHATLLGMGGATELFVHAMRCASVEVEGQVYEGVDMVRVSVNIAPPDYATGFDRYVLEWVLDTQAAPALAQALADRGWPVREGSIAFAQGQFSVAGPGLDYLVVDAPQLLGVFPIGADDSDSTYRLHHEGPLGHAVLNDRFDDAVPPGASAAQVIARAGVLADLGRAGMNLGAGPSFMDYDIEEAWLDDKLEPGEIPE